MLKRLIAALAIVTTSAFAAGPHDGIYAFNNGSPTLMSVHQNGSTLVLVTLSQRSNTLGGAFSVAPSYTVTPAVASIWEYAIGTLNGSEATVENPGAYYGACVMATKVTFDGIGGMTLSPVGGRVTAVGTAAGVNCNSVLSTNFGAPGTTVLKLTKAF